MTDFKIMFPSMEADVIEAVLRANGGAVDTTIDNLLTMSADAEADQQVRMFRRLRKYFRKTTITCFYFSNIFAKQQSLVSITHFFRKK
jgi:hypothetical protein